MQNFCLALYFIAAAAALPKQESPLIKRQADATKDIKGLPLDQPPIPLTDEHIKAPDVYQSPPAPDERLVFPKLPEESLNSGALREFDCAAFDDWTAQIRNNTIPTPPSKWIQVPAGNYRYKLGPHDLAEHEDSNLTPGFNLIIYAMKGGWTLDLRGVTFYIDATPENRLRRGGQMIYTLQSEGLTILGGTLWIDMGELHTQARVTSIAGEAGNQRIEYVVEDGYDLAPWRKASARNQRCVDVSSADHWKHVGCNMWQFKLLEQNDEDRKNEDRRLDLDFSKLDSERKFSGTITNLPVSKLKEGLIITMMAGPESVPAAMSNEDNSNLVVKGFVTNAGFSSIGTSPGQVAPHYENCYEVNPPPRPGFARRVHGPGLSWGNLGGFVYNGDNAAATTTFDKSFYQSTGNPNDLIPGARMMEPDPMKPDDAE